MTGPILIKVLASENEGRAVAIAAERVRSSLIAATNGDIDVSCQSDVAFQDLVGADENCVIVTSLLAEAVVDNVPWPEVETRLRARYEALSVIGSATVFIMTVFRHVGDVPSEQVNALRLRIRQLDRLVADLSREFGVMVIDIDRDFANLGACNLQTDYRMAGVYAPRVAAKTIALAVLSMGLDAFVPFEAQDAAKALVANDEITLAVPLTTEVKPSNILSMGTGRNRQSVKTIVDTNSEHHAGWLVHLLLTGQFSLGDALAKVRGSIARRGLLASAVMILAAVRQSGKMKRGGDRRG
jgi:hypothetical protein